MAKYGLGVNAQGSFFVVGATFKLETVEQWAVAFPGGGSHELANRFSFQVQVFGWEAGFKLEESYPLPGGIATASDVETGWAALRGNDASFVWERPQFTGDIPRRIGGKLGGSFIFGGSLGAWFDPFLDSPDD